MATRAGTVEQITKERARGLWLRAQRLDTLAPFGEGPSATLQAIAHLGYVQIDTINVIERCHHHILHSRIPAYRRRDLVHAQSVEKSVFEYWTHALAYVPTSDLPYFLPAMRAYRGSGWQRPWFANVKPEDVRKVLRLIRKDGPLSIRDIDDDELVEKDHAWASRKPSKRALQLAFFCGDVTVAARQGMLKSYDLLPRHFSWQAKPKAANARQIIDYKLERALRSQGVISLDSICHLDAASKPAMRAAIEARMRAGSLVAVAIEGGDDRSGFWAAPEVLASPPVESDLVHVLSPFDPLIIQRKRLKAVFDYDHLFEAYVPKEKRKLGYFALPVVIGDTVAAALDLKADRGNGRLLVQSWTWVRPRDKRVDKRRIEEALDRFAAFQFAAP